MKNLDLSIKHLGEATIPSPLSGVKFIPDNASVIYAKDAEEAAAELRENGRLNAFELAGPRERIYHDPSWTHAAILTAGGLCPGLNDVIKGLTRTLMLHYNVPIVFGIRYGYQGLVPSFGYEPMLLTPDSVDGIHEVGGTVLGSSRGRQDEKIMVDTLKRMNIKILFCIGGDGTLRCAHDIAMEAERRGLNLSVICIPKTIDNDINFIDKTFGFETAVYATSPVISAAHNEAKGTPYGVGLIHVMGRDSGFIAAYATQANTHVNYCLVPEDPFSLYEGEHALFPSLERRLRERKHAVIIVSEGAGQHLFEEESSDRDKSGNVLHHNIGEFLREKITEWGKSIKLDLSVKYFDPSYQIRSLPAHGTDAVFCEMLSQHAVHAAMAGCTDMVVGHWNDRFTHVPIPVATSSRKKIDVESDLWSGVKSVTWKSYR